jgi:hypothetical protein
MKTPMSSIKKTLSSGLTLVICLLPVLGAVPGVCPCRVASYNNVKWACSSCQQAPGPPCTDFLVKGDGAYCYYQQWTDVCVDDCVSAWLWTGEGNDTNASLSLREGECLNGICRWRRTLASYDPVECKNSRTLQCTYP